MISERTLRKWRREALEIRESQSFTRLNYEVVISLIDKIIRLTQELSDILLIKKG